MALWLIRAGSQGEHERKFLAEERVFLTWEDLGDDLTKVGSKADVEPILRRTYPDFGEGRIKNHLNQIWAFVDQMEVGDWFAMPSKISSTIHFGEIAGPCKFDPDGKSPYMHYRACRWIAKDVPRSRFDQDLLYSMGAFLTICRLQRNDAEARIKAMAVGDWKAAAAPSLTLPVEGGSEVDDAGEGSAVDLERLSRDQIARMIQARFKGHGMALLVEAILKAQGYTTFRSPEGADHGVDILAGTGPMGFGEPRICVQVKSGDSAVDRPTVDQLVGTMHHVGADHGLFVAWGGFKSSVDREAAQKFFKVRLWDQDDLIEQIFRNYDALDAELRAELPLKRIWTVAGGDTDS